MIFFSQDLLSTIVCLEGFKQIAKSKEGIHIEFFGEEPGICLKYYSPQLLESDFSNLKNYLHSFVEGVSQN